MKKSNSTVFQSVENYLCQVPEAHRAILERLRALIKDAAPEAGETISYQLPAYTYRGVLVYFGAWKNHWALYPASSTVSSAFEDELAGYKQSKGTIQFPWDSPLPEALITRLIKKRMEENETRQAKRK